MWLPSKLYSARNSPLVIAFSLSATAGIVSEYIGNLNLGADCSRGLLDVLLHVRCRCSTCAVLICVIQMFLPYAKRINLGGKVVCASSVQLFALPSERK